MSTIAFGETIHRELMSLGKAIEEERDEQVAEFSHLLGEKFGVFCLHLNTYLALVPLLEAILQRWRLGVFRGEAGYDIGQDATARLVFERWVSLSVPMRQRMEFFARHGLDPRLGVVEELSSAAQRVSKILASWQSPTLARCKALRVRYATPEEATELGLPTG